MTSGARSLQREARQRGGGQGSGTRSGRGWHAQEDRGAAQPAGVLLRDSLLCRNACTLLTPQRCSSHLCWDGPGRSLQSTAQGSRTNQRSVTMCMHAARTSMRGCCGGRWVSGRRGPVLGAAGGACMLRSYPPPPQPAHLLCACNGPGSSGSTITGTGQATNKEAGGQQDGLLGACMRLQGCWQAPKLCQGTCQVEPITAQQCQSETGSIDVHAATPIHSGPAAGT